MTEIEIWKPIKNWEDLYEASNLGRVRSKDRVVNRMVKGKLIPSISFGYKSCKD